MSSQFTLMFEGYSMVVAVQIHSNDRREFDSISPFTRERGTCYNKKVNEEKG